MFQKEIQPICYYSKTKEFTKISLISFRHIAATCWNFVWSRISDFWFSCTLTICFFWMKLEPYTIDRGRCWCQPASGAASQSAYPTFLKPDTWRSISAIEMLVKWIFFTTLSELWIYDSHNLFVKKIHFLSSSFALLDVRAS